MVFPPDFTVLMEIILICLVKQHQEDHLYHNYLVRWSDHTTSTAHIQTWLVSALQGQDNQEQQQHIPALCMLKVVSIHRMELLITSDKWVMQPPQQASLVSVLLLYSTPLLINVLLFSVAAAPTSVVATRIGFSSVSLSWTAPSSPPAIYGVFYQVSGMSSTSGGTTSNTELTLTGLALGSYSIFIVGSGADGDLVLPSAHSNMATVTIG